MGVITVCPLVLLKAQPCDPADPNCDPGGDPDAVPLDPGSWILAAAGVGYGVKKWWDAQQNSRKDIYRISDARPVNKGNDEY